MERTKRMCAASSAIVWCSRPRRALSARRKWVRWVVTFPPGQSPNCLPFSRPGGSTPYDAKAGQDGGQPEQRALEGLLAGQGHDVVREYWILQHGGRQEVPGLCGLRAWTRGLSWSEHPPLLPGPQEGGPQGLLAAWSCSMMLIYSKMSMSMTWNTRYRYNPLICILGSLLYGILASSNGVSKYYLLFH